jgi:DNA-binding MltR family transcriptional regulator
MKEKNQYFNYLALLKEFDNLFTYNEKDDRNKAIMGSSFLEMTLTQVLKAFLPQNDKEVEKLINPGNGALGTFSSKISLVYVLGLMDKIVKTDLHLIRKIRNEFAHNIDVSFDDKKIAGWCKALKWHRETILTAPPPNATNRDLFQVSVHQIVAHLHGCISIAAYNKRNILNE